MAKKVIVVNSEARIKNLETVSKNQMTLLNEAADHLYKAQIALSKAGFDGLRSEVLNVSDKVNRRIDSSQVGE